MTNKHRHAEAMALYAKDAMHSETPWIYWEYREFRHAYPLHAHPEWNPCLDYRRKPDAPDWDAEKFAAGREFDIKTAFEYFLEHPMGCALQRRNEQFGCWLTASPADLFNPENRHTLYRVKPPKKKMIIVNGVEVPMHETEPLKFRTKYFVPTSLSEGVSKMTWFGDHFDRLYLDKTLVYLNRDDAQARLDAMIKYEEVQS
jgi:hypothetical protein